MAKKHTVKSSSKLSNKIVTKLSGQNLSLEPIYQVWAWILLAWSLYRYFIKLPEAVDEFFFKPLIFVVPVVWYVLSREKRPLTSIGLNNKNFFKSFYIGLGFGALFALEGIIANWTKNGHVVLNPIDALRQYGVYYLTIISLATAFSEELLTRGFLFNRIYEKTNKLVYAAIIGSILFVLLHVPILVTSLNLQGSTLVLFFVTNTILGVLNCFIYSSTESLVAPILIHVFWNMTVALFL
jgi:uncharacterized protein